MEAAAAVAAFATDSDCAEGLLVICVSGALESSTYVSGPEQDEVFAAGEVAVALKSVVELSATETSTPPLSSADGKVEIGVPRQSAPV